jgi:hypothetical protein
VFRTCWLLVATRGCFFLLAAGGGCSSGNCLGRRSNTNKHNWKMLRCDENNRITALDNDPSMYRFQYGSIFGVLPPEISKLTALQDIIIPEIWTWGRELTLTGPLLDYISIMTSLQTLEVTGWRVGWHHSFGFRIKTPLADPRRFKA